MTSETSGANAMDDTDDEANARYTGRKESVGLMMLVLFGPLMLVPFLLSLGASGARERQWK